MKAPQTIYLTPLLVEGCGKSLSKRVTENDAVYIRNDLIKAEIERQIEEHKDWSSFYHSRGKHSDFEKGAIFALDRMLHFIDNLRGEKSARQRLAEWSKTPEGRESYEKVASEMRREISEKPMNLDELMKEAQRYYSDNFEYLSSDQPTLSILTNIARHFAQWGAEHLADARKTSPKDLADAAKFSSRLDGFFYGKGYEQAEKDLGWISVKDKLPGPSEWVLACIEQHGHAQCLTLAVYSEETKEWHTDQWEDGEQETYNPDYWMPIPNIIKDTKK